MLFPAIRAFARWTLTVVVASLCRRLARPAVLPPVWPATASGAGAVDHSQQLLQGADGVVPLVLLCFFSSARSERWRASIILSGDCVDTSSTAGLPLFQIYHLSRLEQHLVAEVLVGLGLHGGLPKEVRLEPSGQDC